jgi:hypothetical protein
MRIKTFVMGSAACLSLAGVLTFATPSFAQYSGNAPQVSTPAEQQQTQQLNGQAAAGTTASPAALNGDASGAADAQAQSDAQKAQYDQQHAQYQREQDRYRDQRARYDQDIRRYDLREYAYSDYPHHVYAYRYGDSPELVRLYLIAQPQVQLSMLPVEGPSGEFVGKVRNVEAGLDGRPRRVEISLNRRVSVWVNPGDLRYDPEYHIVFTDLTRDQLWTLPGATFESDTDYRP